MRAELAELKIEALLHDPPGKAATLWYRSHESLAAELVAAVLGRPPRRRDPNVVALADRFASAVDRAVMPRDPLSFRVDFLADPQIVHPVAGNRYELAPLRELDVRAIEEAQRRAVRKVVEAAGGPGGDAETLYWHLWRGLPAAVEDEGELGKLWRYLPADTRVPDHPIWDHMRLASAFAGALPAPALLVFSFGPVQSFIEAARRTSDLWAGSVLLSWLAWSAMQPIVTEYGADAVLFPDLHGQPLVDAWLRKRGWKRIPGLRALRPEASLPNRFLALVPTSAGEALAREAEAALSGAMQAFVERGLEALARWVPAARGRPDRARRQCEMTFTCQWHVVPWTVTADSDGRFFAGEEELRRLTATALGEAVRGFWETRDDLAGREMYRPNVGTFFEPVSRLAEAGHGAAKATRRFAQVDERGERCHVCGYREAFWSRPRGGEAPRPGRTRKGEFLCGVCWARRWAPRSEWAEDVAGSEVGFPSTHTLAATRFLREVVEALARVGTGRAEEDDRAVADAARRFVDATRDADRVYATNALAERAGACGSLRETATSLVKTPAELLDPAVYDERSVREGSLEELGLRPDQAAGAAAALRELLRACQRRGIGSPGAYYAVVALDGDHMGEWLSGARAPGIGEVLHTAARPTGGDSHAWLGRQRPLSSAHQVAVSRALNQFALDIVPPIVERVHGGVVVYAGGDDVLALVPLEALLACLGDLRRLYSGVPLPETSPGAARGWQSGGGHVRHGGRLFQVMGERATCSAGVAVAHQKWPLRHALETAREMEKVAKRERCRNAVAIALLKRSGAHERFAARWGEKESVGPFDPMAVLDRMRRLIAEEGVSRRFAYALREEAETLWPIKDALEERAAWLITHHGPRGAAVDGKPVAQNLRALAEALDRWIAPETADARRRRELAVDEFRAAVGLAEFLARGGRE